MTTTGLASDTRPPRRLLCLDVQPEMLGHVRQRLEACGLEAAFVRADARALPLLSGSVDHVLLITVLGEIPDRSGALTEVARVLRGGGRLSVVEQFPDPDFITRRVLRRELTAAGFTEVTTRGCLVYVSTWSRPPVPDPSARSLPGVRAG